MVCSTQGGLAPLPKMTDVCRMYFKITLRKNPGTNSLCGYYRLVESYRNVENRICHRTILNVGFLDHVNPEQLNKIQKLLTQRAEGKISLFREGDPEVQMLTETLWQRMVVEKRIDMPEDALVKRQRLVDIDTIKHRDVREIGAEWMAYQALGQLKVPDFLRCAGWGERQIQLALTQVIGRAVYPASELKTARWAQENSAVCEVTGYPLKDITKDKLYQGALSLCGIKDQLEQHLSKRTNELFDIDDKIILYDLTNTYFEGEKRNSKMAKFGRSKEKRNDAKLIVLAMVVNPEGFLKYSNIFDGNTTDSSTLSLIVEKLRSKTSQTARGAIVVIDAGIATEANLELLEKKGYDYVCVSRKDFKDFQSVEGAPPQVISTRNKQELTVQRVTSGKSTDYFLRVKSPGKELKETGMKNLFESRFEECLTKLKEGLAKKNTVKRADLIHERIGRYRQKYPSVSKYYRIDVKANDKGTATGIHWDRDATVHQKTKDKLGVYFVRTTLKIQEEEKLWKLYNTIRDLEYSFRTLKTDLDLRPIYHKNDDATLAHLNLGLLGYWIVNTIRYQLKRKDINHCWQEIVRIGNTHKIITTTGTNLEGRTTFVRRCSEPNASIKKLYAALNYKMYPFIKRKSVVHKSEQKKAQMPDSQSFAPD
jgi:transposase